MTITICTRSTLAGILLGTLFTASAWYGSTLAANAEITRDMLQKARCDEAGGWVSIVYADGSQYMCTPRQIQPPTSREEESNRRKQGRRY